MSTRLASSSTAAATDMMTAREFATRLSLVAVQLAALLLIVRLFALETPAFFRVMLLVTGGFLVHASLAERFRLPFFAILSMASVVVAMGVDTAGAVLAIGAALVTLAHLPIRLALRVLLLLLAGAAMAALRIRTGTAGMPDVVWIVLASMFMFRLALYLHALRHDDGPFTPAGTIAYFFMVPNVCFPLFPVVDYRTFLRTRFDSPEFEIYDRGIRWMLRGIVHLLIYRVLYFEVAVGELFVSSFPDLLRHVFSTFGLYLKVSGQFHLIVGMLHLFGFRLPPTHHLYFLSTGFTDFWRRINIYWKDFLMKLVYYPSFFALRAHGNRLAIMVSTLLVFLTSWALHSYQYFWINGTPLLAPLDVMFWGILAVLVLGATFAELDARRGPAPQRRRWALRRGLATVGTFLVIAVLWSLWSARSLDTWLYMWTQVQHSRPLDWLLFIVLLALGVVATGFAWGSPGLTTPPEPAGLRTTARATGIRLTAIAGIALLGVPAVTQLLPRDVRVTVRNLRGGGIAIQDDFLEIPGYYEALAGRAFLREDGVPARPFEEHWAHIVPTDGLLAARQRPWIRQEVRGRTVSTNSWGMRDREYSLVKPDGTVRIAVIGPSDAMGWGVSDHETFENRAEGWLDAWARTRGGRIEILNFSQPDWSLAQEAYAIERRAAPFQPDLVLLVAHPYELLFTGSALANIAAGGISVPDSALGHWIAQAGITAGTTKRDAILALRPLEERIHHRTVQWAAEMADAAGARLAILTLRLPALSNTSTLRPIRDAATREGIPVLECADAWDARVARRMTLQGPREFHPNAEGHEVLAECLRDRLMESDLLVTLLP